MWNGISSIWLATKLLTIQLKFKQTYQTMAMSDNDNAMVIQITVCMQHMDLSSVLWIWNHALAWRWRRRRRAYKIAMHNYYHCKKAACMRTVHGSNAMFILALAKNRSWGFPPTRLSLVPRLSYGAFTHKKWHLPEFSALKGASLEGEHYSRRDTIFLTNILRYEIFRFLEELA